MQSFSVPDPEAEGTTVLQNVRNYLPSDTVTQHDIWIFHTITGEPQISCLLSIILTLILITLSILDIAKEHPNMTTNQN